jgi:hypothetical protein
LSYPEGSQSGAAYTTLLLKYWGNNQSQGSTKKPTLRYRIELHRDIYSQSSNAADNSSIKGRIDWTGRFKFGERKANLNLSSYVRSEQNSYYSQIQRQVAETSEGDLIENRFSFDSADFRAELKYYVDKKTSWSLLSQVGQRNYQQDYEDIGLERLDYTEFRVQPGLRYKADSGLNARLFLYHKSRSYKGLHNAHDNQSSLLEYSLKGYGVALSKPFHQRVDASLYLSGYFARDNGQGIRDLDFHKLSINLNYQLGGEAKIVVKAQAYWRDYLNSGRPQTESETGTSASSRRGTEAELIYSRPLFSDFLRGSLGLRRQVETNEVIALDYRRYIFSIGLHYEL